MKRNTSIAIVLIILSALILLFPRLKIEYKAFAGKDVAGLFQENANLILHIPGESFIYFSGEITDENSKTFNNILEGDEKIKSLYIDSPGGSISSAIDMARLLRAKSVKVIVVGQCHSACADYIFAGAKYKSVLPGGIVAIHEPVNSLLIDGHRKNFLFMDFEKKYIFQSDIRKEFDILQEKKHKFLKEINVSEILHDSYRVYLRNKNSPPGKRKYNCPILDGWALSEKQMKLMGVEGLGDFWYPESSLEQAKALGNLKIPSELFFFGGKKNIESLCQEKELTFIENVGLRISQFFEI
jgi:ATP-dependent protease ClpP protease subunit